MRNCFIIFSDMMNPERGDYILYTYTVCPGWEGYIGRTDDMQIHFCITLFPTFSNAGFRNEEI